MIISRFKAKIRKGRKVDRYKTHPLVFKTLAHSDKSACFHLSAFDEVLQLALREKPDAVIYIGQQKLVPVFYHPDRQGAYLLVEQRETHQV